MNRIVIVTAICVVVGVIWLRPRKQGEIASGSRQPTPIVNPRRVSTRASGFASPPPAAGQRAGASEGIAEKLDRLYRTYQSSPNPGYTNILETLRAISAEEPTASDLFKDACTYVGMRTEILKHIQSEEQDIKKRREWMLRANTTPEAQSNAVTRFDASAKLTLESLQKTEKALKRIFGERFSQRYGLDQGLVMERLSGMTLFDTGPELWIRCDENISPYAEPGKAKAPGPHELLPFLKRG